MQLGDRRKRRKPSLTPMIDVVFLLLVFFMLAARFGHDMEFDLALGGSSEAPYSGPPRFVEVMPEELRLNGAKITLEDLPVALGSLMNAASDTIVLRAKNEVELQRVVEVMEALNHAGLSTLALVE